MPGKEIVNFCSRRGRRKQREFRLESNLKIGQFSFSEQDLVLPVNGIPLTVTRTYNSLNPRSGDFGYSWTMALNAMDVQLDDQRKDVTIGGNEAPFADDEEDDSGLPKVVSIRTGGGWDVTLTLPDGRRTTFAFTPRMSPSECIAYAEWTPPPDVVGITLKAPPGHDIINTIPVLPPFWQDGGDNSTLPNHDVPGWILETQDKTQYYITRGSPNNVTWDNTGEGHFINVLAYGPPKLTEIHQRTGERIKIGDTGITNYAAGPNGATTDTVTRWALFERDGQNRITDIRDTISGSDGAVSVRYIYNRDTGNLIQVLKLTDRTAGTYVTNRYHYDNPNFPHYLTSIDSPLGVPIARNEYDDSGRLTAVVDADGNRTEFYHDTANRVEVVIDRLGRTNSHAYDVRGNVTASTNALGEFTLMSYDDKNNVTSTTDTLGHTASFGYDDKGNQTNVVNALNRTNSSTYDVSGNLTSTRDPLGNGTTNLFDEFGNLTNAIQKDANGGVVGQTFSVYDSGKLVMTLDANGQTNATFGYDDYGNLSTSTDAKGFTRNFGYDLNGNQTNSSYTVNGANITTRTEYDAQGRVIQSIDALGNTNQTFYNPLGKVDHTIDKLGNTNRFFYDARGNLVETIGPDGLATATVYGQDGRPIYTTDRNGISGTLTEYDAAGRVTNTVRLTNITITVTAVADGIWSSSLGNAGIGYSTNSTEYFANGWVKSRTGPDGQKTSYTYYDDGQTKTVTDALTNVTTYAYDESGRQMYVADALNHTNQFVFDAVGRNIKTIFADNTFITNIFNLLGQQVAKVDQASVAISNVFDLSGQLMSVVMPSVPDPENGNNPANPAWTYAFDQYGRQTAMLDAKSRATTNVFDQFGREIARRLPMGETNWMKYDALGRLSEAYDFKLQKKVVKYDWLGRVATNFWFATGATYPSNSVEYYYNTLGQLTNITERSGTNASSGYIASVDLPRSRNPYTAWLAPLRAVPPEAAGTIGGLTLSALFLFAFLATDVRRWIGVFTEANAGNKGLISVLQWFVPSFSLLPSVKFGIRIYSRPFAVKLRVRLPSLFWRYISYLLIISLIGSDPRFFDSLWTARASCASPANNPSTDTVRITLFTYDFDNHLTQVNCPEGEINYGYDVVTGRHTSTCTTNSYVAYDYDQLGRLKTVTISKRNGLSITPEATTYTYTAVGSRSTVTNANGIITIYLYDNLNRLTNLTHNVGGTNLASYSYQLHPTGRRTNAVEILKTEDTGTPWITNTLSWAYDQMYRLTNEVSISSSSATSGTYTNSYQYDQVGNRFRKIHIQGADTSTTTNVFNDNHHLLSEVTWKNGSLSESNSYAYDGNGSLNAKAHTESGSTTNFLYGYNLKNKLSTFTRDDTTVTNYFLYNDQGIRVRTSSSSGGSPTLYLIDANNHTGYQQILEELTARGVTATRSYVIGDDVLGQAGGSPTYFLYDGHGSTRQLADPTAAVSSRYNYDAYGSTLTTSTGTTQTDLLYCGEQYDSTIGMYNLRARFYDPSNGRFNASDTFKGNTFDPKSLHKYAYANCDPVNGMDPSGMFTLVEILSVALIIYMLKGAGLKLIRAGVAAYKLLDLAPIMGELAKLEAIEEMDLIDLLEMRNEIVLTATDLIYDIGSNALSLAQEALTTFASGVIFMGVIGLAGAALEGGAVAYEAGDVAVTLGKIERHHTVFQCAVRSGVRQRLYYLARSLHVGAPNGLHYRLLQNPEFAPYCPSSAPGQSMLEILNRVGREPWLEKMGEAYKWLEETFPADYPGIYDVFKKAVKSIGGAAGLI